MINPTLIAQAKGLSTVERIELIEQLWESLANEDITVSSAQKQLLDQRLAEVQTQPQLQSDWAAVKERLQQALP